jgi:thymidylate kinase
MIIEFVGLPGAGKSTIARHLVEKLERRGQTCVNSPTFATLARPHVPGWRGRIQRAAHDLLLSIGPTWTCRHLLLRIGTRPDPRKFRYHYWRLMRVWRAIERVKTYSACSQQEALIVLDQGILQCLPSIFPECLEDDERSLLTLCAVRAMTQVLPDIVVLVSIDTITAARRVRTRPYQRTTYDLHRSDLEVQLEPGWRYAEYALAPALATTAVRLIEVNGFDPPEVNAQLVMDHLEDDTPAYVPGKTI